MAVDTLARQFTVVALTVLAFSASAAEHASLPALESNGCAPAGDVRGDAEAGSGVHREYCAECHGYDGRAEVIVMHMDEPPRDQTDPEYMRTLSDLFLYLAICKGGEAVGRSLVMPGWGDLLTDREIRDLVALIRSFSET